MARLVTRFGPPPLWLTFRVPEGTNSAFQLTLDKLPNDWGGSTSGIVNMPAGLWHIKAVGVAGVNYRFYRDTYADFVEFYGEVDMLARVFPDKRERFWAGNTDIKSAGTTLTVMMQQVQPPA